MSKTEVSKRTNTDPMPLWTRYLALRHVVPLLHRSIETVRRLCSDKWVFACPTNFVTQHLPCRDLRQLPASPIRKRIISTSFSCRLPTPVMDHPAHMTVLMLYANLRIPRPHHPLAKASRSSTWVACLVAANLDKVPALPLKTLLSKAPEHLVHPDQPKTYLQISAGDYL